MGQERMRHIRRAYLLCSISKQVGKERRMDESTRRRVTRADGRSLGGS